MQLYSNKLHFPTDPSRNASAVAQCQVLYNDTLVLNGSMSPGGRWTSPTNKCLCSSAVCTLTNPSYNMGGVYTFEVNTIKFRVYVSVLSELLTYYYYSNV